VENQDNLTDRNDAPIMLGSSAQNVANFVDETKVLTIHHALARSTLDRSSTLTGVCHGNIHQAVRSPKRKRLKNTKENSSLLRR
jgi:hypothetical protein